MTKNEILDYLQSPLEFLLPLADELRRACVKDLVKVFALQEFGNCCWNHCSYCMLRVDNTTLKRYRMSANDMVKTAQRAANLGFRTIVLQSGENIGFSVDEFCRIIAEIKSLGLDIVLSIGARSHDDYQAFFDAGAKGYLMRIETTNKKLYNLLHPGHPSDAWDQRANCLYDLKNIGYKLASGFMVGLPGQTFESIVDDIRYMQELDVALAGIGPFIPSRGTPLAKEQGGTLSLALRATATMRLVMPSIDIPATTAMDVIAEGGRRKALRCGANVVMPSITTKEFQELYQIYEGKSTLNDSLEKALSWITGMGRTVDLNEV